MTSGRFIWGVLLTIGCWIGFSLAVVEAQRAPHRKAAGHFASKLYFELRSVSGDASVSEAIKIKARERLLSEMKQHPSVVLDLGLKPAADAGQIEAELQKRHLLGYALALRITKHKETVEPPAAGKKFLVFMAEYAVAIDAETLPSGKMALAGEGNAQVGVEGQSFKESERQEVRVEALTEAIKQAAGRAIKNLSRPARLQSKKK